MALAKGEEKRIEYYTEIIEEMKSMLNDDINLKGVLLWTLLLIILNGQKVTFLNLAL